MAAACVTALPTQGRFGHRCLRAAVRSAARLFRRPDAKILTKAVPVDYRVRTLFVRTAYATLFCLWRQHGSQCHAPTRTKFARAGAGAAGAAQVLHHEIGF